VNSVVSILVVVLTPLITWAVTLATQGVKIDSLEKKVEEVRVRSDSQVAQYQDIISRLSRIEGKLEQQYAPR
jgi:hypothetical protein